MPSFISSLHLATFASVRKQERELGLPRDVLEENKLFRVETAVKSLPRRVKPGLEVSRICARGKSIWPGLSPLPARTSCKWGPPATLLRDPQNWAIQASLASFHSRKSPEDKTAGSMDLFYYFIS